MIFYNFIKIIHKYFCLFPIFMSLNISGPAVCLFRKPYYESLKKALKPGGIICSQGELFYFCCFDFNTSLI